MPYRTAVFFDSANAQDNCGDMSLIVVDLFLFINDVQVIIIDLQSFTIVCIVHANALPLHMISTPLINTIFNMLTLKLYVHIIKSQ